MYYSELINRALNLSFTLHADQKDKSGVPYVYHPMSVAEIACEDIKLNACGELEKEDEYVIVTALLHDSIEDTYMTAEQLESLGYPQEVVDAIKIMTHDKEIPYFDYVRKVKTSPITKRVKLADLTHNSNIMRLCKSWSDLTDKENARLEKYKKAREILLEDDK